MANDIGFIGIGNMGFQMAGNVRKKMPASSVLHIFDVNSEACKTFTDKFAEFGTIKIDSSSKEIAEKSSTVISIVPMDQHAQAVYLDPKHGVIAASKNPDRLILECSTINVSTTQEIGKEIMEAGLGFYVDTPVSGGVRGAEAGTLSFFCGNEGLIDTDTTARRIRDIVSWMAAAERINFCGGLGKGLVCKTVNNYIGITNIAVAAEGMAFGLRHGVDKDILYRCVKGSSGDSWVMSFSNPVPGVMAASASSNGFKAGFTSRLCAKDINLAIKAAKQVGINPTMGDAAVKHYERADQDARTAGLDGTSIWLHINDEVDAFAHSQ